MRRIGPDRHHRASLALLIGMGVVLACASTANADYLLFTGATWNSGAVRGVIATPSGAIFDVDSEQLRLITTHIEDDESVVFDLETGDVRLDPDPPSSLLAKDPFFLPFARELEVQRYTEASGLFDTGPSDLEVDEFGALVWAGPITAPPGAGGGGGGGGNPPTDSDGDGVPDSSDNCPGTPNPGQQNNDGDSLGDACDPDDDNDGLSDVLEIGTYGTNPFLWDSDGDLISDLDEINAGSDPNDPDSPGPPAIPALGTVGMVLLSLILMTVGVLQGWGRRAEQDGREA